MSNETEQTPPLTPAQQREREALDKLREDCDWAKLSAWSRMRSFVRMSPTELSHCGYKTPEQAVFDTLIRTEKECDKLSAAFFRKFPD